MTEPTPEPATLQLTGRSEQINELAAALSAFQGEIPTVERSATAEVRGETKDGRAYNYDYTYAELDKITLAAMPILAKNGLAFTAWPITIGGRFTLIFQLLHSSGQWIGGDWPLPLSSPQEAGSMISYARRYSLCAVTGIAPAGTDDDAQVAQRAARSTERWDNASPARPTDEERRREARAYLRSVIDSKGLNPDAVRDAFVAFIGTPINEANVDQIRLYTDHVQRTGSLIEVPESPPPETPAADTTPVDGETPSADETQPGGTS